MSETLSDTLRVCVHSSVSGLERPSHFKCRPNSSKRVFPLPVETGHFTFPWHRQSLPCQAKATRFKDYVDRINKTPDNGFVFKQVFLFLLGFALSGQGIAGPMSCSSLAQSDTGNMEMSHCSETDMDRTADDSNKSKDCCGSDCTAMLQCTQSTATVLASTAFAEPIATKAMSHTRRLFGNPAGMHGIPEIKPPIIA